MSGEVCTKEIRRLEREGKLTRHVPIIAVSANAREEQIRTAMEAGTVRLHPLLFVLANAFITVSD